MPTDVNDLEAERQGSGFGLGDFGIRQRGWWSGGTCIAIQGLLTHYAIDRKGLLTHYAIDRIRLRHRPHPHRRIRPRGRKPSPAGQELRARRRRLWRQPGSTACARRDPALLTVVVPCCNEEAVLAEMHRRPVAALDDIPRVDFEVGRER